VLPAGVDRALYAKRDIRDLSFCENVEIREMTAPPEDVLSAEDLRRVLIQGEQAADTYYEVTSGDSLIAIANTHEMQLGQLRYANPELIGKDLIKVGDKLSLTPPSGMLTVQFTERVTEKITLPFSTETKTSASLYTTQSQEEKKGQDGLREVVADKVYVAGVQTQNNILRETVLKEPVTRVVVKGTKRVTNAGGSTTYIWPTQGSVSSTFKMRWGRMHNGLDIAAPTGTPIYAARDGRVTFSGTNGDYGKLVKIDHGGGVETRYGHCSSLKVSQGASVKKGQIIAYVGSTGRSTGPHRHFEIRVGGDPKDPKGYLPK
jgi:murein DD-endopeptidase MepM/ murein hydrolase activator NlpD